ncbi:MAG: RidA family protein, partial [Rhodospirillales bacterium]|nr:RidA family protein [Rhodospirillales bacterium]
MNSGDVLSQAVEHSGVVYLAGLTADDTKADIEGQTRQVLDKIDAILAKMGTDKSKLLSATLYFTRIGDKAAANEVWKAWLGKHQRPARAGV